MKKLTALLLGCMMITAALVSCGDEDDDDGSSKKSKKKSSSVSSQVDEPDNDDKVINDDEKTTEDDEDPTEDDEKPTEDDEKPTEAAEKPTKGEEKPTEPATAAVDDVDNSDKTEDDYVGKWEAIEMTIGETTVTEDIQPEIRNMLQMELFDDGTGYAASSTDPDQEELSWKLNKKGNIEVEDEDGEITKFALRDDELYTAYESDGVKVAVVFESVKKFTEPEDTPDEKPTEETTKKPSDNDEDSVVGEWDCDDPTIETLTFDKDGKVSLSMNAKEMIYMDGDKCYFSGQDFTEYLEFDGETFKLSAEGADLLTMKKIEGDSKGFDGEYKLVSGVMYDTLYASDSSISDLDLTFTFDGKDSHMNIVDLADYEVSGSTIKLSNLPDSFSDSLGEGESDFELDGDTLTLIDKGGDKTVLTRKK